MEAATRGPIVIGGTKWPSMTSTWMIRAPAAITSSTCEPSFEKSDERIEGATRFDAKSSRGPVDAVSVAASKVRSSGASSGRRPGTSCPRFASDG